jgi:hypothetical protein
MQSVTATATVFNLYPSQPYDPRRRDAQHDEVLRGVLARVAEAEPSKVVIFDLDSTLFDNRPRQVQILREFGLTHRLPELSSLSERHFLDWDLKAPLVRAGIDEQRAEVLFPQVRAYWKARFFTSPYCLYDVALPGAADYVSALHAADATIVYLTGRHEAMREGTHESLLRFGFPAPGMLRVHLLMKPSLELDDTAFKATAHRDVEKVGHVIAAFDNEPAHALGLKHSFPDATVVWLDTDRSKEGLPRPDLPRTYGFLTDLQD